MSATYINKELLKKIFSQMSGTVKEDDELVPEYAIQGQGYDWFWYTPHQMMLYL